MTGPWIRLFTLLVSVLWVTAQPVVVGTWNFRSAVDTGKIPVIFNGTFCKSNTCTAHDLLVIWLTKMMDN